MTVPTAHIFFSLLSLAAATLAVAVTVAAVAARRNPHGALADLVNDLRPLALWIAFLIAAVATLGSLYYSEIAHFEPCKYCWYQRIAMYPLALMLGLAALYRDPRVKRYLIPLALAGAAVSTYHYYIERFPDAGGSCSVTVPCNAPYFEQWGFITLAFMALTGFLAVVALLSIADRTNSDQDVKP